MCRRRGEIDAVLRINSEESSMKASATGISRHVWRRALPILGIAALLFAGTATGTIASRQGHAPQASRYGGSISIRTIGPDDCLNDQLSTTNVANQIDVALMDPLITADQKGRPSPDLATSW